MWNETSAAERPEEREEAADSASARESVTPSDAERLRRDSDRPPEGSGGVDSTVHLPPSTPSDAESARREEPVSATNRAGTPRKDACRHVTALEPVDCLRDNKKTQLSALPVSARHLSVTTAWEAPRGGQRHETRRHAQEGSLPPVSAERLGSLSTTYRSESTVSS